MHKNRLILVLFILITPFIYAETKTKEIDVGWDLWYRNDTQRCYITFTIEGIEGDDARGKDYRIWDYYDESHKLIEDWNVKLPYECPDMPENLICPTLPEIPACTCQPPVCEAQTCPEIPACTCPQAVCEAQSCPTYDFDKICNSSKERTLKDYGVGIAIGAGIVLIIGYFYLQNKNINLFSGGGGSSGGAGKMQPPNQGYGLPRQR